jgi:hypothetical protein
LPHSTLCNDNNERLPCRCAICLADYEEEEEIAILPCRHRFHAPVRSLQMCDKAAGSGQMHAQARQLTRAQWIPADDNAIIPPTDLPHVVSVHVSVWLHDDETFTAAINNNRTAGASLQKAFFVSEHKIGYKAEKQRKGKNPNSKAAKTKSNQNHSNGTTAPREHKI